MDELQSQLPLFSHGDFRKSQAKITMAFSITLYGCELWTVKKNDGEKTHSEYGVGRILHRYGFLERPVSSRLNQDRTLSRNCSDYLMLSYFGH